MFFQEVKNLKLKYVKLVVFGLMWCVGVKVLEDLQLKLFVDSVMLVMMIVGKIWMLYVMEIICMMFEENFVMIEDLVVYFVV